MTPISQTNFDPNQAEPEELEDIFASTDNSEVFSSSTPSSQVLTPEQTISTNNINDSSEETYTPPSEEFSSSGKIKTINWRLIIILAIIVAALLTLVGVGFGVYYWYNQNNSNSIDDDTINANAVINMSNDNINVINDNTNDIEIDNTNSADITNANVNAGTFIDSDHDGLSDEEELIHNTNPKKKDTDEDGLTDREEIRVYLTDPRNSDTDGDSYMDGVEVSNFYHPNDPDPKKRLFDIE